MPRMGETVNEGTVNAWFKKVGDQVTEGEPLLEIGTDKVDTEIPAPASGTLSEIRVPEGETVDVMTVIAVIS
jgi:pyruvate dehydrogenase E2 component (dihydrolipoamide acetyltransferase)